jgi:rhamnose utilization protein RhaD (predicted bifunctional aldolase and dehydrogenase)
MVPVDHAAMRSALISGDARAENVDEFTIGHLNASKLRPSIETGVHAVIQHNVVAHIHCVSTIALAVRKDAPALIAERLDSLSDITWRFIPYHRPGVPLAQAILAAASPEANVLILGNHGLVAAGESVAQVETLLDRVCAALAAPPRASRTVDASRLTAYLEGSGYRLPINEETHIIALDESSLPIACGASLYPDHVIFLGAGVTALKESSSEAALNLAQGDGHRPAPILVLPGLGVVLHNSTGISADAMALCLADVTSRIPPGAAIERLSPEHEYELTNWDAEKYRQALEIKSAAP